MEQKAVLQNQYIANLENWANILQMTTQGQRIGVAILLGADFGIIAGQIHYIYLMRLSSYAWVCSGVALAIFILQAAVISVTLNICLGNYRYVCAQIHFAEFVASHQATTGISWRRYHLWRQTQYPATSRFWSLVLLVSFLVPAVMTYRSYLLALTTEGGWSPVCVFGFLVGGSIFLAITFLSAIVNALLFTGYQRTAKVIYRVALVLALIAYIVGVLLAAHPAGYTAGLESALVNHLLQLTDLLAQSAL